MQLIIFAAAFTVGIGAQPSPTSYRIVQHHLPAQSQYTTFYPRKAPFLAYSTGQRQSFADPTGQSIFGYV